MGGPTMRRGVCWGSTKNFRLTPRTEAHAMDHLSPALAELLAPLHTCFRAEVFTTFQAVVAAWLVCPGPRTLSEVWQVSSRAGCAHWDAIYSLFNAARWDWDEVGALLCLLVLTQLVPTGHVWIVIDDTLCHKRGAKV